MKTRELMQKPNHKNNQRGTVSTKFRFAELKAKATPVKYEVTTERMYQEIEDELNSWYDDPDTPNEMELAMKEEAEKAVSFLLNPENSHKCWNCPYNEEYDSFQYRLPCGQQNCWVDLHNPVEFDDDEDEFDDIEF